MLQQDPKLMRGDEEEYLRDLGESSSQDTVLMGIARQILAGSPEGTFSAAEVTSQALQKQGDQQLRTAKENANNRAWR
jgi:hypothetical protein